MKEIIVHAGSPKTGSTSIQNSLKLSYFDDDFDKFIFFGDFYYKKKKKNRPFRTADILIKFFKQNIADLTFSYLPKKKNSNKLLIID